METIEIIGDDDAFFVAIASGRHAASYDEQVAREIWKNCGLSVAMAQSFQEEPLIELEEEDDG